MLKAHCAIAFIPDGRLVVLGVDDEDETPNFSRNAQAPLARSEQELAAQTLSLQFDMRGDPGEFEATHIVLRQALCHRAGQSSMANRRRRKAVKAEYPFRVRVIDRAKCFCAARIVVLPSVLVQELVQIGIAAIELFPIVRLRDRSFMPGAKRHIERGNAAAASRSLAFGAGGFSSSSNTRM